MNISYLTFVPAQTYLLFYAKHYNTKIATKDTLLNGPNSPNFDVSYLKIHIEAMAEHGVDLSPDASSQHLHNCLDTILPPAHLHGAYTNNRPLPTAGIADRHAYFVSSGIAGLCAVFFLIRDGHMPAEKITLLEAMIDGGALDGVGNAEEGYLIRGGREMDMTHQNFWDVFSEIPALELPAPFTVLDEYRIVNDADKNG